MVKISEKTNRWIGFASTVDPMQIYTPDYHSKYLKNAPYLNAKVRRSRLDFVTSFVNLNTCFEYGCGPEPLDRKRCLACYDPFVEEYKNFNRELFNQADTLLLFDVLEHMSDPRFFLSIIPQNRIIMTLPIFPTYLETEEDLKGWKHYKENEHVWYFTLKGIEEFLLLADWQPIQTASNETPPRQDVYTILCERKN